jgi:hypothetical protein
LIRYSDSVCDSSNNDKRLKKKKTEAVNRDRERESCLERRIPPEPREIAEVEDLKLLKRRIAPNKKASQFLNASDGN